MLPKILITKYQWNKKSNGERVIRRKVYNPTIINRFDRNEEPFAFWSAEVILFKTTITVYSHSWGKHIERIPDSWMD